MKNCKTCREIEENAEIFKGNAEKPLGMTKVAKVQIVIRTYDKQNRRRGHLGFKTRPLNFCPECGKPIDRGKTVWQI